MFLDRNTVREKMAGKDPTNPLPHLPLTEFILSIDLICHFTLSSIRKKVHKFSYYSCTQSEKKENLTSNFHDKAKCP